MKKNKSQKTKLLKAGVFIDGANIFYASKSLKYKIDFKRLLKYLNNSFSPVFVKYYTGYDPKNQGQMKFLNKLESFGYELIKKPVKYINTKNKIKEKANLDVELAIDALTSSGKFKNVVLVSGDSDFEYLLTKLRERRKIIFVISARGHISKELIRNSHHFIPLESLKSFIAMKKITPVKHRGKLS